MLALHHASKHSPITMDFSEEFSQMELPIIQKFEVEESDSKNLTQIITAYSKAQLGSVEFYGVLEKFVGGQADKDLFNITELANIMYSYSMNPNCSNSLVNTLKPALKAKMHTLKAKEIPAMIISMKAMELTNSIDSEIISEFDKQLIASHEFFKVNDLSDYYQIRVKHGKSYPNTNITYK
jgi:hypothetical protein